MNAVGLSDILPHDSRRSCDAARPRGWIGPGIDIELNVVETAESRKAMRHTDVRREWVGTGWLDEAREFYVCNREHGTVVFNNTRAHPE